MRLVLDRGELPYSSAYLTNDQASAVAEHVSSTLSIMRAPPAVAADAAELLRAAGGATLGLE